jgi:hypothetical protein
MSSTIVKHDVAAVEWGLQGSEYRRFFLDDFTFSYIAAKKMFLCVRMKKVLIKDLSKYDNCISQLLSVL